MCHLRFEMRLKGVFTQTDAQAEPTNIFTRDPAGHSLSITSYKKCFFVHEANYNICKVMSKPPSPLIHYFE